jgi:hypothetical protein
MGEIQVPGRRAFRQDAGRDRLRQHRLDRRRPSHRPEDEGGRLRSLPVGGAGRRAGRGEGRARRAAAPRRLHHLAHPAHRQDPQHHRCGRAEEGQEGRAHRQLRARRAGRRAGDRPGAGGGPRGGCGFRRLRGRAGQGQPLVRPRQRDLHAAPGRGHVGGAGERRPAGGRADGRLPAQGRDHERGELPQHHRRRGAATEALGQARRASRGCGSSTPARLQPSTPSR